MTKRRTKGSRGAHDGRADVQKGVHQLARSVKQIQVSLRRAERKIEADARDRVRQLRHDARAQLAVLRGHQREASRIVRRLSSAAQVMWSVVNHDDNGQAKLSMLGRHRDNLVRENGAWKFARRRGYVDIPSVMPRPATEST